MIKKIIFNTAKEQFRKAFRKHKAQIRNAKRLSKIGKSPGVEPYDLKKASIKRQIRNTKFMDKAAYQQAPKTTSIPRGGNPRIVGKAYASDRAAKRTMMIPMMTAKERAANQESISQSVRKFISERMNRKKYGGVMKAYTGKAVRQPSETNKEFKMRHAYHTPFMKYKPKMLIGGLITKGIKAGIKKLGKRTINLQRDIMAKSIKQHRKMGYGTSYRTKDMSPLDKKIKRLSAKEDMRAGILMYLKDPKDKAKIRASRQKSIAPTIKAIGESIRDAGRFKKKLN